MFGERLIMPEEKALAKAPQKQSLREYMRSTEITTRFAEVVGKQNANSYIASVLIAVSGNEDLQKCEMRSIVSSALRSATLKLSVDPATGYAYLVPYGSQANLIVGYKGLYQMAIRTNKYRAINVFEIYDGENPVEDRFTGFWSIEGAAKNKEKVIGIMAYFELLRGYKKFLYMTLPEIEAHARKFSKSFDSDRKGNIWKTNRRSMEKKTVLRLLLTRWADLSGVTLDEIDADGDFTSLPEPADAEPENPINVNQTLKDMGFEPDDEPIEGEFEPETTSQEAPPEKKVEPTDPNARPRRPYEPEYLKKSIIEMALKYQKDKTLLKPTDRATLLPQMRMLFVGIKEDRELSVKVLMFLTGVDNSTSLQDHEVLAIKAWLDTKPTDTGELLPSANATDEAEKIIAFLNK
jgi:recombination protein RecT